MHSCRPCVAAGVTALAWSPEEQRLVVGAQDGMVTVWDVQKQRVSYVLMGHTGGAAKGVGTIWVPRRQTPGALLSLHCMETI